MQRFFSSHIMCAFDLHRSNPFALCRGPQEGKSLASSQAKQAAVQSEGVMMSFSLWVVLLTWLQGSRPNKGAELSLLRHSYKIHIAFPLSRLLATLPSLSHHAVDGGKVAIILQSILFNTIHSQPEREGGGWVGVAFPLFSYSFPHQPWT